MTCAECLQRLPEELDQPALEVARHVRECPGCRRELARLRAIVALLEADPPPPVPPLHAGIWSGVAAAEAAAVELARAARADRLRGAAALVALLVGLIVYLQLALPGLLPPLPAASALVELLRAAGASLLGAVESTFFDLLDWTRWLGSQALSATPGWADAVAPLTVSLLALLGFEWHARRVQRPALSPLATRRIA